MVKFLKKYQVQSNPFQASKDWNINNVDNDAVLLFESTGSDDGLPLALEFVDYGDGTSQPVTQSSCDIALEQQEEDRAIVREGLKLTTIFYPETDPKNHDDTYKRMIYAQVNTMFYRSLRDVTKMLGVENIDLELGKTKRKISDLIRVYEIPRLVFGDKIVPNSIQIFDTTQDDDIVISDDGFGNLVAGPNVFSKHQSIGKFDMNFSTGSNTDCNSYLSGSS
jgi:hypothetical protein